MGTRRRPAQHIQAATVELRYLTRQVNKPAVGQPFALRCKDHGLSRCARIFLEPGECQGLRADAILEHHRTVYAEVGGGGSWRREWTAVLASRQAGGSETAAFPLIEVVTLKIFTSDDRSDLT